MNYTVSPIRAAGALGLAVLLVGAGPVLAQDVHWDAPAGIGTGQRATLDLVFENTEPAGAVSLPRVDGLDFLGSPSRQSQVSVVNGRASSKLILSYPVRAALQGEIDIPSFQVSTANGTATVAGVSIDVGAAVLPSAARTGKAAGVPVDDVVRAELRPAKRRPYAGEVFNVDLTVTLAPGRRGEIVGTPSWDRQEVVAEPFGEGHRIDVGRGAGVRMAARAMAPQPGSIEIQPAHQDVRVDAGSGRRNPLGAFGGDMFANFDKFFDDAFADSFFARASMTEVTVESNPVALDVQPLPQPAPPRFSGAVGNFRLESKVVPENAKAGEPVTWTLTLSGTGNWPGGVSLPPRAVPAGFRTLRPKQQRSFADDSLFTGSVSEDVVMIPSKPGSYHLEPVSFVYFDPRTGKYETTVVEPPVLEVTGTAIPPITGAMVAPGSSDHAGGPGQSFPPTDPSSSLARATTPEPPPSPVGARLPREPQAGVGVVLTPLPHSTWLAFLVAPLALVLAYWLFLALRRARLTDPRRRRREALKRLAVAIGEIRRADCAERRRGPLLAWQHSAAAVLEIDFAAPTPAHLQHRSGIEGEWIALWTESDRALYGRDEAFEPTWCDRASSLRRRIRWPLYNPLRAFLPRNLLPTAAVASLLVAAILVVTATVASAEPDDDYAAGNFAAARDQWQSQVAEAPSDWVARYNLGLAEAQLGEAGAALGHTASAFLHNPANEPARWNLGVFAAAVPGVDSILARFARGDGGVALASLLSPAVWQLFAVAGALFFGLGAAFVLHRAYAHGSVTSGIAASAAGALVFLAAWACLHQYAYLAEPHAAVVARSTALRSVPTDADGDQVQHGLDAGAVVVAEKNFLGWTKVRLPGGESGWMRTFDLVALYGSAA